MRKALLLAMILMLSPWPADIALAQGRGRGRGAPDLTCVIKAYRGSETGDASQPIANGQGLLVGPSDPKRVIWATVTLMNQGATEAKDVGASLSMHQTGGDHGWNLDAMFGAADVPAGGSAVFPPVTQLQLPDQPGSWSPVLKARADRDSAIPETNERNNECSLAFTVAVGEVNLPRPNPNPVPIPIPAPPPVQLPRSP